MTTTLEINPITRDRMLGRIPYRIVCRVCDQWDAEMLTVLEAAAINRVLSGDPQKTRVRNRCQRYLPGFSTSAVDVCGGLLRVEP